jgi:hypothetical protein
MKPTYSSTGAELTVTVKISEFSGREKVCLFGDLMREMGLWEVMTKDMLESPTWKAVDKRLDEVWWSKS